MFDRYTEKARRVIFFARYEASQFGAPYIETEHLLMGVTREDKGLTARVNLKAEAVRRDVEARTTVRDRVSTSVDLPLSQESKRVLAYAAEEAQALNHDFIDTGHLLLGLMRDEKALSSIILREHGVKYDGVRAIVRESAEANRPSVQHQEPRRRIVEALRRHYQPEELREIEPASASLKPLLLRLQELVEAAFLHAVYTESYGNQQLKRKPWSRKQAMGHLIDCATTHHRWLARALTEPQLVDSHGHPREEWVTAERYDKFSWQVLMDSWVAMNNLLIYVIAAIPQEKVNLVCRIGIDEPVPLGTLIERYVAYAADLVGQILARL